MIITGPFCVLNNLHGIPMMIIIETTHEDTMDDKSLTLGRLLGQTEAFTAIAARCTAAQAAAMRTVREEKLYLGQTKDWEECCYKFFHTGKDNANRFIRLLEDFGPEYFLVAQYSRISASTYRALQPAIRDNTLHHNGEAIALIPENAGKVAAAVNDIRKTITIKAIKPDPEPESVPVSDPILPLERQCTEAVSAIERIIETRQYGEQVRAVICYLRTRLNRLEMTL
jgi:hypothetical protein